MAEHPYLPLIVQRLLADTTHMTAEQFGAYSRILYVMWLRGARLPDSEVELARISGLSLRRWRTVSDVIMREFFSAGGLISQKRLTDTWLKVQEKRQKAVESAERRWLPANAMRTHSDRNANQNQNKSLSSLPREPGRTVTAQELMSAKKRQSQPTLPLLAEVKGSGQPR